MSAEEGKKLYLRDFSAAGSPHRIISITYLNKYSMAPAPGAMGPQQAAGHYHHW